MSEPGVTEVYFYHLEVRSLEQVLPTLLERSLKRGWRAAVQAASEERVEALNTWLWTYRDESFLPHGTARDGYASAHPIYLTAGDDNPNGAQVRFLVDGATLADAVALRAGGLSVRRPRSGGCHACAGRMAGGESTGRHCQLLAAGCRRTLAEEGVTLMLPQVPDLRQKLGAQRGFAFPSR